MDWFQRHVNPSRCILCLEVRESHSLLVYIYIFVWLFLRFFLKSNTNNFKTVLFDGTLTASPLRVRVDLEVIVIKKYTILIRSPKLEFHHHMKFSILLMKHTHSHFFLDSFTSAGCSVIGKCSCSVIEKYRINYLPLAVKGSVSALPRTGAHLTPFNIHHLYAGCDIMRTSIQLLKFQDGRQQISLAVKPFSLQPTFWLG